MDKAPKEAADSKSSLLNRLPRLSMGVWLILIGALFIIIMVPLVLSYVNTAAQQHNLRVRLAQLQAQHSDITSKINSQSALLAEINKYKKDAEAVRASYREVSENPEIAQALVNLAWDQDITITGMSVSRDAGKLLGVDYPALTYSLSLSGQVAGFQNLLIEIGKRYPSSQVTLVNINPAQDEGELDKASVTVRIYCDKDG